MQIEQLFQKTYDDISKLYHELQENPDGTLDSEDRARRLVKECKNLEHFLKENPQPLDKNKIEEIFSYMKFIKSTPFMQSLGRYQDPLVQIFHSFKTMISKLPTKKVTKIDPTHH